MRCWPRPGLGLVALSGYVALGRELVWLAFLLSPLAPLPFRARLVKAARARLPAKLDTYRRPNRRRCIPRDLGAFLRAWALTGVQLGHQGGGARTGFSA